MNTELQTFFATWEEEATRTAAVLRSLPANQYDFRADPKGRSLGEMAWHLAEIDAYMSFGVTKGSFSLTERPDGLQRPRAVAELAPGYERVHRESVARLKAIGDLDLAREIAFFGGRMMPVRRVLWDALLHHTLHHRGQLVLMVRIAGGTPPGLYGPTREETEAMRAKA